MSSSSDGTTTASSNSSLPKPNSESLFSHSFFNSESIFIMLPDRYDTSAGLFSHFCFCKHTLGSQIFLKKCRPAHIYQLSFSHIQLPPSKNSLKNPLYFIQHFYPKINN